MLSTTELIRYQRHLCLPQMNPNAQKNGQERLKESSVLVVGLGGLGCPILSYLAAAGVGTLGLLDYDQVDLSNLQRQVIYRTDQVGTCKTAAAENFIQALNPHVRTKAHPEKADAANVADLVAGYDIIIDASDSVGLRYLLNDACFFAGKPYIYGSIFRFEGQLAVFDAQQGTPCYRCLFPQMPSALPDCSEAGVLGVLPGLVGVLQASEAIKIITGIGQPLYDTLLLVDALSAKTDQIRLHKSPDCKLCGRKPSIVSIRPETPPAPNKPVEQNTDTTPRIKQLSAERYAQWRAEGVMHRLIDVREGYERDIANIGGEHYPFSKKEHLRELADTDTNRALVLLCHKGGRSAKSIAILQQTAPELAERLYNLSGGIDAWSRLVDAKVQRY